MGTETIEQLVQGGKATAAPPLGPALGPMGVNIGEVIAKINEKTASFNGMQVPVSIIVDTDTKAFEIEVGTPPASALIKSEAKISKGSSSSASDKVADLKIEQTIKIAKMKESGLLGKTLKEKVKEIIGTCVSMGVMVEGVDAKDAIALVNEGKFDQEIKDEKTELSAEELKEQEAERQKLQAEIKERHAEFEARVKAIVAEMPGQTASEIKKRMQEEEIPEEIFKEFLPK
ncbi:50S ribosomal protein L11, partial [Candidatus Woesearchaeota archaeon]|nr:50S ribosomal protein L11 [Candidatus Woesearchaeota archaeon]